MRKYPGNFIFAMTSSSDLEARAVRVAVDRLALRRELLEAALEPLARDVAEVALGVVPLGHLEAREHRLAELERRCLHRSAISSVALDAPRVRREELRHLVRRLQVHLARAVVALLRLVERAARLDARQVEVRLGVGALGVVDVVGRDERQAELARELDEDAVQDRLLGQAVVLQLDVEAARLEARRAAPRAPRARALALLEDGLRDTRPPMHPVIATSPFECAAISSIATRRRPVDVPARDEPDEVLVALGASPRGAAGGMPPCPPRWPHDVELAAEDRPGRSASLAAL